MKIIMLETALGAEDGYRVSEYEAGREYDVSEALGGEFIRAGQARPAQEPKAEPPKTKEAAPRRARASKAED